MHELAITRSIVAIVGEAAKGRRVTQVTLEIGTLSGVMADAVAFCFDVVAEGTLLEGAKLDIRQVNGRARCQDCTAEFAVAFPFGRCACGSRRVVCVSGEELNIESMLIEEEA